MSKAPTEAERDADDALNMLSWCLRVANVSTEAESAVMSYVRAYGAAMKEQGKAEA